MILKYRISDNTDFSSNEFFDSAILTEPLKL